MNRFAPITDIWNDLDSQSRLRAGVAVALLLAVGLLWSFASARVAGLERKRLARETVLKELLPLTVAYRSARQSADQLTGRLVLVRPDDSPARIIEETGIKGKGVKVTPVKGEERSGMQEEAAEVRIEGLTANESINLLYRLEKGSRPLTIRKAGLKARFDDPSRFDLSLTVALLKPAAGQPK